MGNTQYGLLGAVFIVNRRWTFRAHNPSILSCRPNRPRVRSIHCAISLHAGVEDVLGRRGRQTRTEDADGRRGRQTRTADADGDSINGQTGRRAATNREGDWSGELPTQIVGLM
jgi:hypothetical protein